MTIRDPITVPAAARALRLRYQVVLRLVKHGHVHAQRVGCRFLVDRADLPRVRRAHPWRRDAQRSYR